MEGTIRILQERNLNNPTNKSVAPIYPVTKAEAVLNSDGKTIEEVTSDLDERLTAAEEAIDIGEVGKTLTLTEENWEKYAVGPERTPAHIDLSRLKITKLVIKNGVHYPIYITLPSTIETIDSSEYNHPISWHTNTSAAVANLKKVISYDGSELALYALKEVPELPDSGSFNLPTGSITISNPQNYYDFNTTQELYNVLYYCITSLGGYTGRLTTENSSSTYPEHALFWGSDMHKKLQQIWDKAYSNLSTTPSFTVTFAYTATGLSSVYQSGTRHLNNTLHCEGSLIATESEQICGLGRIHLIINNGSYSDAPLGQSKVGGLRFAVSTPYPVSIIDGGIYNVSGYYGESNSGYTVTINSRTYVTHTSAYVPSDGDYVFADATCDSEQDYGKTVIGLVADVIDNDSKIIVQSKEMIKANASGGSLKFPFGMAYIPYGERGQSQMYYPDIEIPIEGTSDTRLLHKIIPENIKQDIVSGNLPQVLISNFTAFCEDLGYSIDDHDTPLEVDDRQIPTLFLASIVKWFSNDPESGIRFPESDDTHTAASNFLTMLSNAYTNPPFDSFYLMYFPAAMFAFLFDGLHYYDKDGLRTTIQLRDGETLSESFSVNKWFLPVEWTDTLHRDRYIGFCHSSSNSNKSHKVRLINSGNQGDNYKDAEFYIKPITIINL